MERAKLSISPVVKAFLAAVDEITPSSVFREKFWERDFPPGDRVRVSNVVGENIECVEGHADILYQGNVIHIGEGEKIFVPQGNDFEVITNGSPAKLRFSS